MAVTQVIFTDSIRFNFVLKSVREDSPNQSLIYAESESPSDPPMFVIEKYNREVC